MKKEDCQKLRREGKSYREISKEVNVPLSTVFLWTKYVKQTKVQINEIKLKSLAKLQQSRKTAQKAKNEKYIQSNQVNKNIGISMVDKIDSQNINGIIAALYWGEGFKKDRRLGLANSDPQIIRLFIYWLMRFAKVPIGQIRLRVGINIMFKDREEEIKKYWSEVTEIPIIQFQNTFYQNTKITRIYPNTNNYYGVLRIRANGQNDIFQKLLGMVDKLKLESRKLELV